VSTVCGQKEMKKTSEFPGIRKKNEKKEKKRKSKNQIRCESSSAEVAQVAEAPLILSLLKKHHVKENDGSEQQDFVHGSESLPLHAVDFKVVCFGA